MRHKVIRHSSINIMTGAMGNERTEEVDEPCNTPLFTNQYERGICNSCAEGWEAPGNYPTPAGRALIAKATGGAS